MGISLKIHSLEKGQFLLGGNLNFSSQSEESDYLESKQKTLNILPNIGSMITDNIALGCAFGFQYSNTKYDQILYTSGYIDFDDLVFDYNQEENIFVLNPYIRFHKSITENFMFYIQPSVYTHFTLKGDTENPTYTYGVDTYVGLLYFISTKLSLELNIAGIAYHFTKDKDDNLKGHDFGIQYNLKSPNIGLRYYF